MLVGISAIGGSLLAPRSVAAADSPDDEKPLVEPEQPDDPPGIPARDSGLRTPAMHGDSPQGGIAGVAASFVQVNLDELGQNIVGDAANEPSIAIDPTAPNRMAIGWRQFATIKSNFRQAGWGWSNDGGRTWTFPGVLEDIFRSDPVLAANSQGQFFYLSLRNNFLCDMFISDDGGQTWNAPFPAFGGDKPWFTIDRSGLQTDGDIVVSWSDFAGCCDDDTLTTSIDGGMTYTVPVDIPLDPIFGQLAAGPSGEVLIAGRQASTNTMFAAARVLTPLGPGTPRFEFGVEIDLGGAMIGSQGPNPAGLLGQANIDIVRGEGPTSGHIYLLCSVNPPPQPPDDDPLDVHIVRSTDGGLSWSKPVRVNDDPIGTNAWQWFGTMSVAPSGRIDVIWNDTRSDPTATFSEVFYSSSIDGGATWSANVPLTLPFNHFLGYPQQNKLGDYYHMISDNVGANLAFAATFNGEQDVYFMRIGEYDCNGNDIADSLDIASAASLDCDCDGIPDECEIAAGAEPDLNRDGVLDACASGGDLDGDGDVGPSDLAALLAQWGSDPNGPPDFNDDNTIDAADLAELLAAWGGC
jgi:hypothetical protein